MTGDVLSLADIEQVMQRFCQEREAITAQLVELGYPDPNEPRLWLVFRLHEEPQPLRTPAERWAFLGSLDREPPGGYVVFLPGIEVPS